MRAVSVLLLAGLALSSCTADSFFRYEMSRSFRRDLDSCRICYGDDCTIMRNNRCRYYVETDEIIDKEPSGGDVTDLDAMMYDLTEQAVKSWKVQDCIPTISAYTNCDKDNICMGCKSCRCSKDGQWECEAVHRCQPIDDIDINHRVLEEVIDKLSDQERLSRKKRAVAKDHDAKNGSFSDIATWMYGVKPINGRVYVNTTAAADSTYIESTSTQPSKTFTKTDSEYLDFEEVLKNIGIDDQNYKRRKSQLKLVNDTNFDYMDMKYYNFHNKSNSSNIFDALSVLELGTDEKETTDSPTNFVIDLIPREYRNDYYEYNDTTDDADINQIHYKEGVLDISNETIELNAINIMKRDTRMSISTEPNISTITTQAPNTTSSTQPSTSSNINILDSVLIPLTIVIDDKKEEIKELIQVKENLISFINAQNITEFNVTNTTDYMNGNNSNVYLSFYNLDLFPDMQKNLLRSNIYLQEKLLYKLNRDIHEVLKDVNYIQKTTKIFGLPKELKIVVNAMKRYMYMQKNNHSLAPRYRDFEKHKNYRRFWPQPKDTSINGELIEILSILDRNKPKSNAMAPVSKAIKKIMKRVIKQNYGDELPNYGGKVYERLYNMSIYLKVIGRDWPHLTANIAASPPSERLHAMKLLHFTMIEDINRIVDAKTLVEFAQTRRVNPVEFSLAEEVMDKIGDGLVMLQQKIVLLIEHHSKTKKDILRTVNRNIEKKSKKESFFRKIKNLLRSSKHDVADIIKQKARDTEIVKSLTKSDDSDYEQTMLKWQKYLNMAPRNKRDVKSRLRKLKNTIKGIIPKYLQGKINPALVKSHKAKNKPDSRKDRKRNKKHQRPVTKSMKVLEHNTIKSKNMNVTSG